MPRKFSPEKLAARRDRAVRLGFVKVVPDGMRHILVPAGLATRAKASVRSLALHVEHNFFNGRPAHYARHATSFAAVSGHITKVQEHTAHAAHKAANRAKHSWGTPLDLDPVQHDDPWAAWRASSTSTESLNVPGALEMACGPPLSVGLPNSVFPGNLELLNLALQPLVERLEKLENRLTQTIAMLPKLFVAPAESLAGLGKRLPLGVTVESQTEFGKPSLVTSESQTQFGKSLLVPAESQTEVEKPLIVTVESLNELGKPMLATIGSQTKFDRPSLVPAGSPTDFEKPLVVTVESLTELAKPMLVTIGSQTKFDKPLLVPAESQTEFDKPLIVAAELLTELNKPMLVTTGSQTEVDKPLLATVGSQNEFDMPLLVTVVSPSQSLGIAAVVSLAVVPQGPPVVPAESCIAIVESQKPLVATAESLCVAAVVSQEPVVSYSEARPRWADAASNSSAEPIDPSIVTAEYAHPEMLRVGQACNNQLTVSDVEASVLLEFIQWKSFSGLQLGKGELLSTLKLSEQKLYEFIRGDPTTDSSGKAGSVRTVKASAGRARQRLRFL